MKDNCLSLFAPFVSIYGTVACVIHGLWKNGVQILQQTV